MNFWQNTALDYLSNCVFYKRVWERIIITVCRSETQQTARPFPVAVTRHLIDVKAKRVLRNENSVVIGLRVRRHDTFATAKSSTTKINRLKTETAFGPIVTSRKIRSDPFACATAIRSVNASAQRRALAPKR